MKLEFRNDDNVMTSEKEPGSCFNGSEDIVLLRVPEAGELRQLWQDFDRELRSELKDLLLRPYGEIVQKLGPLGFSARTVEGQAHVPYGMLLLNKEKLAHFSKPALFQAAAALDLVPDKKPNGRPRKRMPQGEGRISDYILAMPERSQEAVIETVVDCHENLDEWMLVSQGSEVGWADVRRKVQSATDVMAFLSWLSEETERMMGDHGQRIVRHAKLEERIRFAPSWFSQYLAARKVWLWPARYSNRVIFMYPARYAPLVGRMSVAADRRGFSDAVFRYHQGQNQTGAAVSLQAFATAALCGNTWDAAHGSFRWYPLAAFKERLPSLASAKHMSTSVNTVYRLAVQHAQESIKKRPEAHFFVNGARLARIGVDAFNWTLKPTPFNTQVASQILGHPVASVPPHVKSWAAQLRELMPLFGNKTVKNIENSLNMWLIYLMVLGPDDSPRDFQTISRPEHVHDLGRRSTRTFWDFLNAHCAASSRDLGNRAMSSMRKAFQLAAQRDAFGHATNPFDPRQDKIAGGYSKSSDMTHRKPLEQEAWELIVRKNRENGYAFARSLGPIRCHYTLRDPETGLYENVFWPSEAVVVDILLNSGMRHISGRWVDSGEGDDKRIDPATMTMVKNTHRCATLKRNDCFLQLVDLPGTRSRRVFGQRVGLNKTGQPFIIPWVDQGVVDGFYLMLALQEKYNPIDAPVKPIKPTTREKTRVNPELFPDIYPLFRDPSGTQDMAVSDAKVLAYWKDLLRHCQDDVNQLFGHEYPLITDDGLVFDLHALRVTMVSNLLEAGVSIELVRDLVGHATWMMTWHYNAMRSAKLNVSIQEAMNRRSDAHDALGRRDKAAIEAYANEAVVPDFVENHMGAKLLRNYGVRRDLSPFEVFLHGICPGGSCAVGGRKVGGKFEPVWRERACSGCRFRVTGPRFKEGIQNRINNLIAELRLADLRAAELSRAIEETELRTGREDHANRGIQRAESRFKNRLAEELAMEVRVQKMVHEVAAAAAAEGATGDDLLLPVVPGFDESQLTYGFAEVHEFELMHTLVKETKILPASIMEIPQGVEAHMKKLLKAVLRANNIAELMAPLSDREETEACLQIGDVLLERYPEPSQFQQLVDGAVKLDLVALEDIRREVRTLVAGPSSRPAMIDYAA